MTTIAKRVFQLCALLGASIVVGKPALPSQVQAGAACTDAKTCNGNTFGGQTSCQIVNDYCSGSGIICQGS
jgi:hypothetical protein